VLAILNGHFLLVSGQPIKLLTNFFKMEKKATWVIHKYRVDFSPDHDNVRAKKAWLRPHKLGMYDEGSMIFTPRVTVRPGEVMYLILFL